jgi:hypothetical protein
MEVCGRDGRHAGVSKLVRKNEEGEKVIIQDLTPTRRDENGETERRKGDGKGQRE